MLNKLTITNLLPLCLILQWGCSEQPAVTTDTAAAKSLPYQVLVVQQQTADSSWGYVIVQDQRVLIEQLTIPAAAGNKKFVSREEALQTGNLVAYKLNHGNHPAISIHELDSLGIHYQ